MKRLALVMLLTLLIAPIGAAEDFTGKWSGAFLPVREDGSTGNANIYMELKHKGKELSGTAGPSLETQYPLKGTVDDNKLTFEVTGEHLMKFALVYADGHLKGEASADVEGQKRTAKIDVQRVKGF